MKNTLKLIKSLVPDSVKRIILQAIYAIRGRRCFGLTYCCPICNKHLNTFTSLETILNGKFTGNIDIDGMCHTAYEFETQNVMNFLCPVCGASDKARLYALFLRQKLGEYSYGERIKLVHFAPEMGLGQLLKWDRRVNYRSADLLREDVDDRVDLTNMTIYPDASMDAFICSHILEHIPDDRRAMSELYRVLKPGGWGIIMAPIMLTIDSTYEDWTKVTETERLKHFGLEDHVRVYAKWDFIDSLKTAGFQVRQLGINHFGKDVFKTCGLSKTGVLYVVEK
jgi:SAM-dependent methyltransferase